jgi:hypothetical protein
MLSFHLIVTQGHRIALKVSALSLFRHFGHGHSNKARMHNSSDCTGGLSPRNSVYCEPLIRERHELQLTLN